MTPTCPRCNGELIAEGLDILGRELWHCVPCHLWTSRPREPSKYDGPLTTFERSMLAHHQCRLFRVHHYCVPLELLEDLEVRGNRIVDSALGSCPVEWAGRAPRLN